MATVLPTTAQRVRVNFTIFPNAAAVAVFLHDLSACVVSLLLAFALRLGSRVFIEPPVFVLYESIIFALLAAAVLIVFGVHKGIWSYASTNDLLVIVEAATLMLLMVVPFLLLVEQFHATPRTVPVIQWLLLIVLLSAPRFACRLWYQGRAAPADRAGLRTPVLLAGAGEGSALLIRAIAADPKALYRVVGILDLNGRIRGRRMHGVPVLGGTDELEPVVRRLASAGDQPRRLIIAEPVDASLLRQLVGRAEALGVTVARLPDPVEFRAAADDGRIELHPVTLQELLGRPQITFDHAAVRGLVEGRRVLVTGAGGSIGGELVRQIASHRPGRLVLLDSCEFNLYTVDHEVATRFPEVDRTALLADVRVRERVRAIFEEHRPELVFHAAALKHVPMVELNPVEGALTNVVGTRNVADAAWACGALAMLQISTDKAVNPTSVMGATKRLAELYCQILDRAAGQVRGTDGASQRPRFMTVRFGNVLGSSGSVVPLFRRQLADGGPLTVTHPDICRYFMTIREAVELVLQAAALGVARAGERGGVFVLDMGEPVRIVDLARHMIRLAGKEPERDVPIVFTGLRPGEKLYEELFDASELRLPAVASGVLMARPHPVDAAELRRALDMLAEACDQGDATVLRAVLAKAVPGYGTTETRANAA